MTPAAQATMVIPLFLVFVRVATCIMIMPGLSSVQVPIRIRLYFAIAISFSIFLLVAPPQRGNDIQSANLDVLQLTYTIFYEVLIGVALVVPLRFLFLALSFLGEIITQMIGLNPIPGTPIADNQSNTVLSGLFNVTASVLFFTSGLHLDFLLGVAQSYEMYPQGETLAVAEFLDTLSQNLGAHFQLVVRLGAPIFIYGVIANLIAGLVNKLTPQIPVYFVSTPFLICGGLIMLSWVGDDILMLFILEVRHFLNVF